MSAPPKMTAIDYGTVNGAEWSIDWCIVRAPLWGAINGYVRIPEGHPWHGLNNYTHDAIDVEVHGGLTFAHDNWIGFDTLHAGDRWPDEDHPFESEWDIFWTSRMVIAEAMRLATQVGDVKRDLTVVDA